MSIAKHHLIRKEITESDLGLIEDFALARRVLGVCDNSALRFQHIG